MGAIEKVVFPNVNETLGCLVQGCVRHLYPGEHRGSQDILLVLRRRSSSRSQAACSCQESSRSTSARLLVAPGSSESAHGHLERELNISNKYQVRAAVEDVGGLDRKSVV